MVEIRVVEGIAGVAVSVDGVPEDEPCYVISVAARMVGVHAQTLRYYERIGLLEPARSRGNIRHVLPGGRSAGAVDQVAHRRLGDQPSRSGCNHAYAGPHGGAWAAGARARGAAGQSVKDARFLRGNEGERERRVEAMVFKQDDFTEQAQSVIGASYDVVRRFKHAQWDVEHVVLALLENEGSVPVQMLRELGVDTGAVRAEIEAAPRPDTATRL